jgi:predicted nucleic acid-binding protein
MIYLDTSLIAPLVIEESSSDAVEALVIKARAGEFATSTWTQVELASLVARKLRMGDISASDADAVRLEFALLLKESFEVIVPTRADYSKAARFLEAPKTSLRAGAALHLAVAANRRAKKILTLDQGFIKAGKQLKLPVSAGIG